MKRHCSWCSLSKHSLDYGDIQTFLSTMNLTYQQKLNSSLRLNVQMFTEEPFKQAASHVHVIKR